MSKTKISWVVSFFVIFSALPLALAGQDVLPPVNQDQTLPDTTNKPGPGDSPPVYIRSNTLQDQQGNVGYDKGFAEGKRAGSVVGQGQWFRIGCNSGCLVPCLGPSTIWILAHNFGDMPLTAPVGDSLYKSGYYEGYFNATRDKKMNSVLTGGIVGTGFTAGLVGLYFLVIKDVIEDLKNRWEGITN